MRIVAGRHRRRRLTVPPGDRIRPTADRAREALFNMLAHGALMADGRSPLHEARVLDAFAGSGALGLEALSRGAARTVFIENDEEALAALRRNVQQLGERERVIIVEADAAAPPAAPFACGLALLDPPYGADLVVPALTALGARGWLAPDAIIVVEIGAREDFEPAPGFTFLRDRRHGAARLVFLSFGNPD